MGCAVAGVAPRSFHTHSAEDDRCALRPAHLVACVFHLGRQCAGRHCVADVVAGFAGVDLCAVRWSA